MARERNVMCCIRLCWLCWLCSLYSVLYSLCTHGAGFAMNLLEPQSLLPQHTYISRAQRSSQNSSNTDCRINRMRSASQTQHTQHTQSKPTKFPNWKFVDSIKFICELNWWWNFKRRKQNFVRCTRPDETHFDSNFNIIIHFWHFSIINVSFWFGSGEIRFFRRIFHCHKWNDSVFVWKV